MRNLVSFFSREELKKASELFRTKKNVSFSGASNSSGKALLLSDILRDKDSGVSNVLWITNGKEEANSVYRACSLWSDRPVYIYNALDDEKRKEYGSHNDFEREKIILLMEFVYRAITNKNAIFVVPFNSILQNFPDYSSVKKSFFDVQKGESFDAVSFVEKIISFGYEVSDSEVLHKGCYFKKGDSITVFPVNTESPVRIHLGFDNVEKIEVLHNDDYSKVQKSLAEVQIFSLNVDYSDSNILEYFFETGLLIDDEIDLGEDYFDMWNLLMKEASESLNTITFTSFNEDDDRHIHLHFLSVLKYRTAPDFSNDLKDKISSKWKILIFTKLFDDMKSLLIDQKVPFKIDLTDESIDESSVFILPVLKDDIFPQSFQNPSQKILVISDIEVPFIRGLEERKSATRSVFDDFLMSLTVGSYVVHSDHGIAKFLGLQQKTVDGVTKEYLALGYAENDKLFVPIDQADKVNKYIGSDDLLPKLTRLGSADWSTITSKVRKETEQIAKELLKLYAERKSASRPKYDPIEDVQKKFDKTFPYEETPGQIKAIEDVRKDMASGVPMDRLVCGDVGFGKTEVAMRAAFNAVLNKKQVALISPITILADQHFKSFKKRMEPFHVRIEMLSRFRTASEQKKIVEKLKKGEIDIIIGTHRLIQPDIAFKNLGLVIIDEEQRFGVKQKEKLKALRKEVDILTLTATPIPRTLNICLNKLRDITTITTPPYGRLPVITEVRKFSTHLVREAILKELSRGGQVYFLHNRVQTIDGFAEKIKQLVPEAKIVVAHGKLGSGDLEERILAFTEGKYDVLISSTIIENGIDLANANTLIVDSAERFGLAQLYQLRGRVGRGKSQAYAYFLYQGQRLKLDAKKRLRAIVEASDLGSGFQIAMKDLEIRGAGDILGANQHGVINVVGVAHFMRMLNKAVEDLKTGRLLSEGGEEVSDVSIELPIAAFIPETYVLNSNEKISAYQKLSSADTLEYLKEIKDELVADFGKMPRQVNNLFRVIELKIYCKKAGIVNVRSQIKPMSKDREIEMLMSNKVKPANIINLLEYNPSWQIIGSKLKIDIDKLSGVDWFEGIKESVKRLSVEAKHGKR
ncbi:MAG: transcription-repair coupling factor [Candidatus Gracilibacteria bacterium]|jgi:transcription-repair coupling factor|nr:transcription-repair coupling factor [Candidatus Gracilibacteria bacterium]